MFILNIINQLVQLYLRQNNRLQGGFIKQTNVCSKVTKNNQSDMTIANMKYLKKFWDDELLKKSFWQNWRQFIRLEWSFLWKHKVSLIQVHNYYLWINWARIFINPQSTMKNNRIVHTVFTHLTFSLSTNTLHMDYGMVFAYLIDWRPMFSNVPIRNEI